MLFFFLLSQWLLLAAFRSIAIFAVACWDLLRVEASVTLGDGEGRLSLIRQGQELWVEHFVFELWQRWNSYILILELGQDARAVRSHGL